VFLVFYFSFLIFTLLPKPYRLPSHKILSTIKKGRLLTSRNFNIRWFEKKDGGLKIAIVVPVRLDKRATKRNRAKRLLREAIRQCLPQTKASGQMVVLATKNIFSATFQELSKEIGESLKKLNIKN